MKRIFCLLATTFLVTVLFTACSSSSSSVEAVPKTELLAADSIYTCQMHQQVIGLKPGHCSVCGMALVKQKATAAQTKMIHDSTYQLPKE